MDYEAVDDELSDAVGGTWALDARTWRVRWSERARIIHGVERGLAPTVWQALDFIEPEDRPGLFARALRCVHDGTPFEMEAGLCTAHGLRKRVRIVGIVDPSQAGSGSLHGTISVVPAAPVHPTAPESVHDMFMSLQEWELVGKALRHELKGPMVTVNAFAEVLSRTETSLSGQGRERLARIRAAARHMDSLLEGLVQFAPLATREMSKDRVDLGEIAHECISLLRAADSDRVVDVRIQEDLFARGDPHMLRLVIQNLLSNAWKFTRVRDVAQIEFARETDGGKGEPQTFVVRDNGVGFDMAEAPRVFAPFERLHSHHDFGGTGLGLAIVRRAVERHSGSVWTRAAVGEGASFYFQLP